MKTHDQLGRKISTLAILVWISIGCIYAQGATEQRVIAITKDGNILKAPATLHINVSALKTAFLIVLQNSSGSEVSLILRDRQDRIIYSKYFFKKHYSAKFDMSQVEDDTYYFEIANKHERYHYHIKIGYEMVPVRSVEVKPQVLS
jgi:hypothetical protein